MKRTIILYHANCPDGMSGAWAAWKRFGSHARYLPIRHQVPLPKGLAGNDLYFIDIICPLPELMRLRNTGASITAIDHHVSAEQVVRSADAHLFDIRHSGGVLAWKYFHPGKPVPKLLSYVEDMDLWRCALPRSKEISATLELYDQTFRAWNKLAKGFERASVRLQYARTGSTILRYQEKLIRNMLAGAETGMLGRTRVRIVNSPVLASELGNILGKGTAEAGIVWAEENGAVKVSLRSDNKTDVAKLAARYGGGGHKNAAAFKLRRGTRLPWKYLSRS